MDALDTSMLAFNPVRGLAVGLCTSKWAFTCLVCGFRVEVRAVMVTVGASSAWANGGSEHTNKATANAHNKICLRITT